MHLLSLIALYVGLAVLPSDIAMCDSAAMQYHDRTRQAISKIEKTGLATKKNCHYGTLGKIFPKKTSALQ